MIIEVTRLVAQYLRQATAIARTARVRSKSQPWSSTIPSCDDDDDDDDDDDNDDDDDDNNFDHHDYYDSDHNHDDNAKASRKVEPSCNDE